MWVERQEESAAVSAWDMDKSMRAAGKGGVAGRTVRGGQSDVGMRVWLADANWRTSRRGAAAYHASPGTLFANKD